MASLFIRRGRTRRGTAAALVAVLAVLPALVGCTAPAPPSPPTLPARRPPPARLAPPTPPAPAVCHLPPVDAPVSDGFRPPTHRWGPGNRGLTYATTPGSPVRASAPGVVRFAGRIGPHAYVAVAHADGLRTTYSYLATIRVRAGQVLTGRAPSEPPAAPSTSACSTAAPTSTRPPSWVGAAPAAGPCWCRSAAERPDRVGRREGWPDYSGSRPGNRRVDVCTSFVRVTHGRRALGAAPDTTNRWERS